MYRIVNGKAGEGLAPCGVTRTPAFWPHLPGPFASPGLAVRHVGSGSVNAEQAEQQLCLPFPAPPAETPGAPRRLSNVQIAEQLEQIAGLLEGQGGNPFRVRAYRTGARTLRGLDRPVGEILRQEGPAGLERLAGIGRSLARTIERMVRTGRCATLDRLRAANSPEKLLATVPDVGPGLARQIHQQLGIATLAELEAAAHDGRLARVPGMGPKRLRAVRESLAGRFRRAAPARRPARERASDDAPVADLLDVDRRYRLLAELGRLPRIAPRRFNPTNEAWLPVMHADHGGRRYTAHYSNTARAHELGTTRDWVVISRDDPGGDGRWTVITGRYGELRDRRVVLGRESECAAHYAAREGRPRPR